MTNPDKIPRIIHYCWFGGKEKPKKIKKCIASWKRYLKEYQFMEWNEATYNIDTSKYVKQAYKSKKYAFVSDYVRLHVLYHHGGIYMDTDVEVLKPLDHFIGHDSFWGFEDGKHIATSIMGAAKGNAIIKEFLDYYADRDFIRLDGTVDMTTNVAVLTSILLKHGLIANGELQELLNGAVIYPRTYFSPYDYINCESFITNGSHTIHHFDKSWLPYHVRLKSKVKWLLALLIGGERIAQVRKMLT